MIALLLLINPDGEVAEITLPIGDTRRALCRAIGCTRLDVVRLTSVLDMWVDDEGLYTQQPNPAATALARRYGYTWQDYYGPAVIASANEHGDTIGLTPEQLQGVLSALSDVTV